MKEYIVRPRENIDFIEKYEEDGTNVVQIKFLDYQGKILHNIAQCIVYFGDSAIEGLGVEALRRVINKECFYWEHLLTSNDDFIYEELGVCLSPDTPEMVFMQKDLNINKLVKEESLIEKQLKKQFDFKIITEQETKEIKSLISNQNLVYGRLEFKHYAVIKINHRKCKIINKDIKDDHGFEIEMVEFLGYFKN